MTAGVGGHAAFVHGGRYNQHKPNFVSFKALSTSAFSAEALDVCIMERINLVCCQYIF